MPLCGRRYGPSDKLEGVTPHASPAFGLLALPAVTGALVAMFAVFSAGASVALNAVLDVSDTFFDMFRLNSIGLVLVASVTCVMTIVVVDVTGRAGRIVRVHKQEEPGVVEICRLPTFRTVALSAVRADTAVDHRRRSDVAHSALRSNGGKQQTMGEWSGGAQRGERAFVHDMAGHTVKFAQLLVERSFLFRQCQL